MNLPLLTRYADMLRYDHERGSVAALDWRAYPAQRELTEYTSAEIVANAIGAGSVGDGLAAAYLAGYGLALAARCWADRPAETQRAAIIQAGEWMRRALPFDERLARTVEQGLARADTAILAGGNAETAVLEYIAGAINRADRVAERCGRIAAGLLDERDHVLTHGFAGPSLNWLLVIAHGEKGKQLRLTVTTPSAQADSARLAAALAREIGISVTQRIDSTPSMSFADQTYQIMVIGADRIAMDGGVTGASGSAAQAELARQHGIPRYILGYDGPDPHCATTSALAGDIGEPAPRDIIVPEQISAIITSRGIYRPEMIARFLGDGDASMDVIPLHAG